MKIFRVSHKWRWRFRNRHGLFNATVRGEAGDADTASIELFQIELNRLIEDECLSYSQVYNGDETGFFWRLIFKNSQMTKDNETFRGKKSSMKSLSVFVYADASGTQRLKLVVQGKFKTPRALRVIMSDLPACYFTSQRHGLLLVYSLNGFKTILCQLWVGTRFMA